MLAKGADPREMMAEIGGKATGTNRGRGGTMHLVDFSLNIFGLNAILGASVPHVAGGVLAADYDGDSTIGVAFFGDGAANQGVVAESMNLAQVWDLPVVFLCENNQYAVTTARDDAVAGDQISDRAAGYGMPGETIDGQDVLEVYDVVGEAVDRARNGGGPHFIECETYLYREHSANVDAILDTPVRGGDERAHWADRDPIAMFEAALKDEGVLNSDQQADIEEEIDAELDAAVDLMRDSDEPAPERATEDVYADQSHSTLPAPTYR
jgi:pyruvate dehydrogenase E1 component alpha subunit